MSITQLSVTDALDAQAQGAIFVDVRSTREFAPGHPAGAVNVPLQEPDEDTGQTMSNPDFVRVMRTNFPSDTALLIGCQSGNRSARASLMLAAFGFTNVTMVTGGFEAWQRHGLPIDTGEGYKALLDRCQ